MNDVMSLGFEVYTETKFKISINKEMSHRRVKSGMTNKINTHHYQMVVSLTYNNQDITHNVNFPSQHMSKPEIIESKLNTEILSYIGKSKNLPIFFENNIPVMIDYVGGNGRNPEKYKINFIIPEKCSDIYIYDYSLLHYFEDYPELLKKWREAVKDNQEKELLERYKNEIEKLFIINLLFVPEFDDETEIVFLKFPESIIEDYNKNCYVNKNNNNKACFRLKDALESRVIETANDFLRILKEKQHTRSIYIKNSILSKSLKNILPIFEKKSGGSIDPDDKSTDHKKPDENPDKEPNENPDEKLDEKPDDTNDKTPDNDSTPSEYSDTNISSTSNELKIKLEKTINELNDVAKKLSSANSDVNTDNISKIADALKGANIDTDNLKVDIIDTINEVKEAIVQLEKEDDEPMINIQYIKVMDYILNLLVLMSIGKNKSDFHSDSQSTISETDQDSTHDKKINNALDDLPYPSDMSKDTKNFIDSQIKMSVKDIKDSDQQLEILENLKKKMKDSTSDEIYVIAMIEIIENVKNKNSLLEPQSKINYNIEPTEENKKEYSESFGIKSGGSRYVITQSTCSSKDAKRKIQESLYILHNQYMELFNTLYNNRIFINEIMSVMMVISNKQLVSTLVNTNLYTDLHFLYTCISFMIYLKNFRLYLNSDTSIDILLIMFEILRNTTDIICFYNKKKYFKSTIPHIHIKLGIFCIYANEIIGEISSLIHQVQQCPNKPSEKISHSYDDLEDSKRKIIFSYINKLLPDYQVMEIKHKLFSDQPVVSSKLYSIPINMSLVDNLSILIDNIIKE